MWLGVGAGMRVSTREPGLAWFELCRRKGRSTWTFLSACPDLGPEEGGMVGLENCQQTPKMELDSLLWLTSALVITHKIRVTWLISYLYYISTVGLLERSAYLLSWVTCPFPEHCGFNWAAPGCCQYRNTASNPRAKMRELKILWRA